MKRFCQPAVVALVSLFALCSCKEDIDISNRYVFKEETCVAYLQRHADVYSEYVDLLYRVPVSIVSKSTVGQLLSARGNYTVFAPTNDAIHRFLEQQVEKGLINQPSWDAFTNAHKRDSVQAVVVLNSIIDSGDNDRPYETSDFPLAEGAELPLANMNERKIGTRTDEVTDGIIICNSCRMDDINHDIPAINGVIHQMHDVIAPSNDTGAQYLLQLINEGDPDLVVMARAIQACGLLDTLGVWRDEVYETLYLRGDVPDLVNMTSYGFAEGGTAYAPRHRLIGFTIFAETDDFWREQGIDPQSDNLMEKLQQWVLDNHQYAEGDKFVVDNNYENEQNLLYQWVTYHILPMKLATDKLVIHHNESGYNRLARIYGVPVYEYYTTMGKRRLLKVFESKESNGVYLNRFPTLDNGRNGTMAEIDCPEGKQGCRVGRQEPKARLSQMVNCNIYYLDRPLCYDDKTRDNLFRERMRFDGMSLFPEAMTNDIRKKVANDDRYQYVYIPKRSVYPYFENMWLNEGSNFVYYNAYGYDWPNMNADEVKAVGRYEITMKLPPVPRRGTYELRYGFVFTENRGIVQIYFGTDRDNLVVQDIPIDLTRTNWESRSGFEPDIDDEDYNSQIDKQMRNLWYMKGAKSNACSGKSNMQARYPEAIGHTPIRRILLRQTLDPEQTYYIRFKSVLDSEQKEFMLDYFEWCSKEVYDNPQNPEDIW